MDETKESCPHDDVFSKLITVKGTVADAERLESRTWINLKKKNGNHVQVFSVEGSLSFPALSNACLAQTVIARGYWLDKSTKTMMAAYANVESLQTELPLEDKNEIEDLDRTPVDEEDPEEED